MIKVYIFLTFLLMAHVAKLSSRSSALEFRRYIFIMGSSETLLHQRYPHSDLAYYAS